MLLFSNFIDLTPLREFVWQGTGDNLRPRCCCPTSVQLSTVDSALNSLLLPHSTRESNQHHWSTSLGPDGEKDESHHYIRAQ